jgi:RHS repeat-associated protein
MTLNTAPGSSSSNSYYYHSDGNGNITMLVNPSQYIVAKYLYDAFGNVLSASGILAQQNLYRFSSKEFHLNSGLSYYLYRYYDPNLQRWSNRDPLGDCGMASIAYSRLGHILLSRPRPLISVLPWEVLQGPNLYRFGTNNLLSFTDNYGLGLNDCRDGCGPGPDRNPIQPPKGPSSSCLPSPKTTCQTACDVSVGAMYVACGLLPGPWGAACYANANAYERNCQANCDTIAPQQNHW